jgi:trk system potassium uptake protein
MLHLQWTPARRIALGYLLVALIGAILLLMPFSHRVPVSFTDAVFTSASASYVTGLSSVNTATTWTFVGKVIIALLIQVGGAGITLVTTIVYLILGRKISIGERRFIAEDKNFHLNGIVRLIKSILYFSLAIEGTAALVFTLYFHFRFSYSWLRAIGFAVFHSVSAFNNAGFDIWGNNLESFTSDPLVLLLTSFLIILGGLGFIVLVELYSFPKRRTLTLHARIVLSMTVFLLIAGTILTLLFEFNHSMSKLSWPDKILNAWFTSASLRTAGFDSVQISSMRDITWFIFTILMFIGASPGSTGGGIKTTTFYMMLKTATATIRGKAELTSHERTIPWDIARKSMVIFMLSIGVVMIGTLIDAAFEPQISFIKVIFEEVSAFGTVGLTTGITGLIADPMKWVLIFTMYIGRIGIFTFLVSMSGRKRTSVSYVQERILIG